MARVIDAFAQFFDDSGDPLIDGWLRFTVSGTNNTDKDTFADSSESIPNTNPLQLDAAGRCPNVFGPGSYRVTSFTNDTLTNTPAQQIQQFDPVGGSFGTGAFDDWNAESIYQSTDIVQGSDGNYYSSLTNTNQGNDPLSNPSNWERIEFLRYYNVSKSYAEDDLAITVDGRLWRSLVDPNLNNDPASDDGSNWAPSFADKNVSKIGGGDLRSLVGNEIQDSLTYNLPLAASLAADEWLDVEIPEQFKAQTPTVQVQGADTITYSGGTDTSVLFNSGNSLRIRFASDGVSDWRF
jgi:hypothetical protein